MVPIPSPTTHHHTCVNKRKLFLTFLGGLQPPMSPKFEQTTQSFTFLRSSKWLDLNRPHLTLPKPVCFHLFMVILLLPSYLREDGALSHVPASFPHLRTEEFFDGSIFPPSSFSSKNPYYVIESTIRYNIFMEFLVHKMLLHT